MRFTIDTDKKTIKVDNQTDLLKMRFEDISAHLRYYPDYKVNWRCLKLTFVGMTANNFSR